MSEDKAIRAAAAQVQASGRLPGVVVAYARGNGPPQIFASGDDAAGRPLGADSLFPVASITKLATALAVLRLADRGALTPDDLLRDHLPYAAAARHDVTLRQLLCHTSGVPVDISEEGTPYRRGLTWDELGHACLETEPETPPGQQVQYSNVTYGLLALVVERHTGQPFPAALDELVLRPLGVEGYLRDELPRPPAQLADVRSSHAGTDMEPFNSPFWRSLGMPWAGLVTNAAGALALARAFAWPPDGFLTPETCREATRNQVGDLGGGFRPPMWWPRCEWGLGPELRGDKQPHWAPAQATPGSFGHSGASGCLAWCDPAAGRSWAILGARTAANGWLLRHAALIGAALYDGAG